MKKIAEREAFGVTQALVVNEGLYEVLLDRAGERYLIGFVLAADARAFWGECAFEEGLRGHMEALRKTKSE